MASTQTRQKAWEPQNPAGFRVKQSDNGHRSHEGGNGFEYRVARASENIAKASDIHKENTEFTAERIKSLLCAYATYARGVHEMQRAYIDLVHRSVEMTQRAGREFIGCSNPSDIAEAQRDLLHEAMDYYFESAAKILRVSSKTADEAVRPIKEHIRATE